MPGGVARRRRSPSRGRHEDSKATKQRKLGAPRRAGVCPTGSRQERQERQAEGSREGPRTGPWAWRRWSTRPPSTRAIGEAERNLGFVAFLSSCPPSAWRPWRSWRLSAGATSPPSTRPGRDAPSISASWPCCLRVSPPSTRLSGEARTTTSSAWRRWRLGGSASGTPMCRAEPVVARGAAGYRSSFSRQVAAAPAPNRTSARTSRTQLAVADGRSVSITLRKLTAPEASTASSTWT